MTAMGAKLSSSLPMNERPLSALKTRKLSFRFPPTTGIRVWKVCYSQRAARRQTLACLPARRGPVGVVDRLEQGRKARRQINRPRSSQSQSNAGRLTACKQGWEVGSVIFLFAVHNFCLNKTLSCLRVPRPPMCASTLS